MNRFVLAVFIVFLSTFALRAEAKESGFNVLNFSPAVDNSPYLSVYGSKLLDQWQFHTSLYLDYGRKPLECNGCATVSVVRHLAVANASFAIGILDWFEAGLGLPFVMYNEFYDETSGAKTSDMGLGDAHLDLKFRILDAEKYPVGLSALAFGAFPTGDPNRYMGDGQVNGGLKVIVDRAINRYIELALNLGFRMRDDVTKVNTQIDDQFLYGLGAVGHVTQKIDVTAEITGYTVVQDFFGSVPQSPAEVGVGGRYRMDNGLGFSLGGGFGITDGVGAPVFRAIGGLSYTYPTKKAAAPAKVEPAPEPALAKIEGNKIVILAPIYFDFDKSTIKPESFPVLNDVATVMANHPEITKVQVEGHTDSKGTDAYNQRLSDARSKSAMDYLVQKGVTADRLISKGFGEAKPIDTNDTDAGRAKNRRTEFTILAQ